MKFNVLAASMGFVLAAAVATPGFSQPKPTKPFVEPPAVNYGAMIAAASGKTDFRQVRWGMSPADVKSAEAKNGSTAVLLEALREDKLFYSDSIAGLNCNLAYIFAPDKLVRALYLFSERHSNDNLYISDFEALKTILVEKYGTPQDLEHWSNDLYRDDPSHYGMAISVGHLVKGARWRTDRTIVVLILRGDNFKVNLALEYTSVELGDLETERNKKKQQSVF